jgi:hypothetical protein
LLAEKDGGLEDEHLLGCNTLLWVTGNVTSNAQELSTYLSSGHAHEQLRFIDLEISGLRA